MSASSVIVGILIFIIMWVIVWTVIAIIFHNKTCEKMGILGLTSDTVHSMVKGDKTFSDVWNDIVGKFFSSFSSKAPKSSNHEKFTGGRYEYSSSRYSSNSGEIYDPDF